MGPFTDVDPVLPPYCTPTSPFLTWLSVHFQTCVPTPLAFVSIALGTLSIVSWLFAQMPQIYKNYKIQSTAGLSIFFLTEWLLGDLTNLLGALFTGQATWQVVVASYYTFVDVCLVVQFFWYSYLRFKVVSTGSDSYDSDANSNIGSDDFNGLSPINTNFVGGTTAGATMHQLDSQDVRPHATEQTPLFSRIDYDRKASDMTAVQHNRQNLLFDFANSMSPKAALASVAVASLSTSARASPLLSVAAIHLTSSRNSLAPSATLYWLGTVLSWSSTILYLASRLPQLCHNYSRKSTAGLSPLLFLAAFSGNFFYSTSLLSNPYAWHNFGPFGGHGWAGPDASDRRDWIARAAPFFLGAAGVLLLDAMMGVQFLLYSEREDELVRVRDGKGHSRWERVNGWMRGWVPKIGLPGKSKVVDLAESQRIIAASREIERWRRTSQECM